MLENTSWDKGHGRMEKRTTAIIYSCAMLKEDHKWPGLFCIIRQTNERTVKGKTSIENRYYISSLPESFSILGQRLAASVGATIRGHWGIENKLHWRLDVNLREDHSCLSDEYGAENMNLLRKLGLNIVLPHRGKTSGAGAQRQAAMSWDYMMELLLKAL